MKQNVVKKADIYDLDAYRKTAHSTKLEESNKAVITGYVMMPVWVMVPVYLYPQGV